MALKLISAPGANLFVILGSFLFSCVYIPAITFSICKSQSNFKVRLTRITEALLLIIFSIGFTLSNSNLPGAGLFTSLNKVLVFAVALPYALVKLYQSYKSTLLNVHGIVIAIYFFFQCVTALLIVKTKTISIRFVLQHTQKIESAFEEGRIRNLQLRSYLNQTRYKTDAQYTSVIKLTDSTLNYTQRFKRYLVSEVDRRAIPDSIVCSGLDIIEKKNYDTPNRIFFERNKVSLDSYNAKALKTLLAAYNDSVAHIYKRLNRNATRKFSPIPINNIVYSDGQSETWEEACFLEAPALVCFNNLTEIQNTLLNAEYQLLSEYVNSIADQNSNTQSGVQQLIKLNMDALINQQTHELEAIKNEQTNQKNLLQKKSEELNSTRDLNSLMVLSMILFGGLIGYVVFLNIKRKQLNKTLAIQNQKIEAQKTELSIKQSEILDSISYARKLQEAILPPRESLKQCFSWAQIYYQPKDIVAGDFYWFEQKGDWSYLAVADCTGHGVPGALVSMVAYNALQRALFEWNCILPGEILDRARILISETFSQQKTQTLKDGMDISVLAVNKKARLLKWAGANNPLWILQNQELKEYKATKQTVGYAYSPLPFTTEDLPWNENAIYVLFTDGMPDQFGGAQGKKMKYKQFASLLQSCLSNAEPEKEIEQAFQLWMGQHEQIDDVCIIAVKVSASAG